jgi:hypothetical protein
VKDSELEWFRPLWLRLLVTGLCVAWFAWEALVNKDQLWMLITGAAVAYAVWNLFIAYKDPAKKNGGTGTGNNGEPKA